MIAEAMRSQRPSYGNNEGVAVNLAPKGAWEQPTTTLSCSMEAKRAAQAVAFGGATDTSKNNGNSFGGSLLSGSKPPVGFNDLSEERRPARRRGSLAALADIIGEMGGAPDPPTSGLSRGTSVPVTDVPKRMSFMPKADDIADSLLGRGVSVSEKPKRSLRRGSLTGASIPISPMSNELFHPAEQSGGGAGRWGSRVDSTVADTRPNRRASVSVSETVSPVPDERQQRRRGSLTASAELTGILSTAPKELIRGDSGGKTSQDGSGQDSSGRFGFPMPELSRVGSGGRTKRNEGVNEAIDNSNSGRSRRRTSLATLSQESADVVCVTYSTKIDGKKENLEVLVEGESSASQLSEALDEEEAMKSFGRREQRGVVEGTRKSSKDSGFTADKLEKEKRSTRKSREGRSEKTNREGKRELRRVGDATSDRAALSGNEEDKHEIRVSDSKANRDCSYDDGKVHLRRAADASPRTSFDESFDGEERKEIRRVPDSRSTRKLDKTGEGRRGLRRVADSQSKYSPDSEGKRELPRVSDSRLKNDDNEGGGHGERDSAASCELRRVGDSRLQTTGDKDETLTVKLPRVSKPRSKHEVDECGEGRRELRRVSDATLKHAFDDDRDRPRELRRVSDSQSKPKYEESEQGPLGPRGACDSTSKHAFDNAREGRQELRRVSDSRSKKGHRELRRVGDREGSEGRAREQPGSTESTSADDRRLDGSSQGGHPRSPVRSKKKKSGEKGASVTDSKWSHDDIDGRRSPRRTNNLRPPPSSADRFTLDHTSEFDCSGRSSKSAPKSTITKTKDKDRSRTREKERSKARPDNRREIVTEVEEEEEHKSPSNSLVAANRCLEPVTPADQFDVGRATKADKNSTFRDDFVSSSFEERDHEDSSKSKNAGGHFSRDGLTKSRQKGPDSPRSPKKTECRTGKDTLDGRYTECLPSGEVGVAHRQGTPQAQGSDVEWDRFRMNDPGTLFSSNGTESDDDIPMPATELSRGNSLQGPPVGRSLLQGSIFQSSQAAVEERVQRRRCSFVSSATGRDFDKVTIGNASNGGGRGGTRGEADAKNWRDVRKSIKSMNVRSNAALREVLLKCVDAKNDGEDETFSGNLRTQSHNDVLDDNSDDDSHDDGNTFNDDDSAIFSQGTLQSSKTNQSGKTCRTNATSSSGNRSKQAPRDGVDLDRSKISNLNRALRNANMAPSQQQEALDANSGRNGRRRRRWSISDAFEGLVDEI